MVECPRCGLYIDDFKPECDICGYQPDWENYYDYDLIDTNPIDKILKYNSYEILDIIEEKKRITPKISCHVCFCPLCCSLIVQNNDFICCNNCGYEGFMIMRPELLWQEIVEIMFYYPLDFVEKHRLDNFWFIVGNEYLNKMMKREALLCYNKAIELNELNGDAWFKKAIIYEGFTDYLHRNECYKNALKCYNQLLKINSKDDYIWNRKGEYFIKRNQLKRALKCFNKAIKYNACNDDYWNNKGTCYKHLHNFKAALKFYDYALSINNK